jgi:hypothetical protein
MFLIYLNLLILTCINGDHFTKFLTYNNLTISDQFKPLLKLKNSFQVSKLRPEKYCMLACSSNPKCDVATIEQNICSLFNNETVLFNTIYSNNITLFSKNKMKICSDQYYVKMSAVPMCQLKKLYGVSCVSTEECLSSAGLECYNQNCLCTDPILKLFN